MIEIGNLFKQKSGDTLVEIVSFWDKRDIDPDCPESIAIVGMVKFVYLNGEHQGKHQSMSRRGFRFRWVAVNA